MLGKKGIALIIVIIIILLAAIAIFGIISFVANSLYLNVGTSSMEGAISAAQAGIYAAINDYLASPAQPYWTKAASVNIIGNKYYSAGKDANFLLIDADNPQTASDLLQRIPLKNMNQTQSITVNQMKVEWYNFSASLDRMVLGGTTRWSGTASSGTLITLSSLFRLNARQSFSGVTDNTWRFTAAVPKNAIIIATFYFTDGSARKAYLVNGGRSGNNEFSITATGEVRGSINWKRTIEATYDVGVNRITSWQEVDTHI